MADSKTAFIFPGQSPDQAALELQKANPVFIDVTANTTVKADTKIRHSLGRVPRGYMIVKQPFPALSGEMEHGEGDTAWDDNFIYVKFGKASLKVTLAIF